MLFRSPARRREQVQLHRHPPLHNRYMTQAARIKGDARLVHDQARIDQIVARVREQAAAEGGSPGLLERIYRALIDCCIAHEHEELRRLQAGPDSASSSCVGAAP